MSEPALEWAGDNPFILRVYRKVDGAYQVKLIDLDERGWKTTYADWFGPESVVYLTLKLGFGEAPVTPIVMTGARYVCRVFRRIPGNGEVRAYGLIDEQENGLWVLGAGTASPEICTDRDLNRVAALLLDRI